MRTAPSSYFHVEKCHWQNLPGGEVEFQKSGLSIFPFVIPGDIFKNANDAFRDLVLRAPHDQDLTQPDYGWTKMATYREAVIPIFAATRQVGGSSSNTSAATHVDFPPKATGQWVCSCRANKDGRCPDNHSNDDMESAFGHGHGASLSEAKKAAEKAAKDTLGAKSTHHVVCRCRDPKGERIIPHAKK